ncbi:tripartite tricarboxylate transporter substrate binding protein BugD [Ramlibacter ginsenosidimutans]|uniref:Tripartite tricarboxylate transporter substrate binding protein BugD n=1 Tax=Ramlibacter ginsenosidimutans TaxID=502333 RepID=A0A934WLA8_9BURK|nr:tripartite tricarboxylate transporter substrate-binding protein [Ramlibacter ginsenosidimutans]MBK6006574.1 tripartite tricarboxylate transporter substrate binding protein BugD [Ramlibacter ginsenosidimutans]
MFRIAVSKWIAAFAALALPVASALADDYPSRSIALVVPFAAGGPTDTLGRILAERMTRSLGQTVVVENVTGAGGVIANSKVIKAAPDGYTAIIGHLGTHVLAPAVQGLQTDYLKEFEPVAVVATNPEVIVSRLDVPAKNLQELVAWVKANPGKVSYASGGAGTPSHIMAEDFSQKVAPLNIVHYRGAAPAMQDVVAGHVDLSFDQAATGLNFARSGKVRAYAVTSPTRVPSAPEIPTVDEAGLPGFYMSVWHGIWMPRGTPPEAIARFDTAVREALADPEVRRRFAELGQEIPPPEQQTPRGLAALHKAETEKWVPIIKSANIHAN